VSLDAHRSYVRIAASDDASGDPVMRRPSPDVAHGRGLLIVDALSKGWGVERGKQGRTVWAEIVLTGDAGASFDCDD